MSNDQGVNERNRIKIFLSWLKGATLSQFIGVILCFFFSRASFFGVMRPFSLALYSAACFSGPARVLAVVSLFCGNLIFSGFYETIRQIATVLIFELLISFMRMNNGRTTALSRSVLMGAVAAGTGLIKGVILGLHVYDLVTSILTAALVFSVSMLIYPAVAETTEIKTGRSHSGRMMVAKVLPACVAVISLEGLTIAGMELSMLLTGILVLIFAKRRGSAYGACVGACLGFVLVLYRIPGSLELPGLYALAGAAAGIKIKFKTVSVSLWMAVVMLFMGLAILGGNLITGYYSILASGIIFLFIPSKALNNLSEYLTGLGEQGKMPEDSYSKRAALEAADKLYILGKALSRVSRNLGEFLDDESEDEQTMAESVIEIVAERVCRRCTLSEKCWGTNFLKTYRLVEKAISNMKTDDTGLLEIPGWFKAMCTRNDRFIESLGIAFSIYKAQKVWQVRLAEARERIAEQAGIISGSVINIARSIVERRSRDYNIEESFLEAAVGLGLPVADIRIATDDGAKSSLDVVCEGINKMDLEVLDSTVKTFLGSQVIRMGEMRRDMLGYSVLRYMNKPRFKTITGVARISRDQSPVSGDSFTFFITGNGLHISAICDGAGSGKKAERYSKNTIQMLEYLLEDGIDINFAVKLIKIYLGIRGENALLATLDVCSISLLDGEAQFFKYGAPVSFIKGKSGIVNIIGTDPDHEKGEVSTESSGSFVSEGDLLVMVSDGVYEAFCEDNHSPALEKYIAGLETVNPQQMADMIMTESTLRGGGSRDDMTVLVTRLW